jgi:predicted dehydrogenase
MYRFGIVGTGWRSLFYLRAASACPEMFEIAGVVTRDAQRAAALAERFGTSLYTSSEELVERESPDFVVTSVPWDVNPEAVGKLVELNTPVLSETPPATTVEELEALWRLGSQGAKVQVAEQYWAQPHHAARLAFARSGKIGRVSQVQVSAAHGYHGISLLRAFLGVGFENAGITARTFTAPIVLGPNRTGPPTEEVVGDSKQTIAWLDFGDRIGVFDFAGDQYFSYIRGQRLLVRGDRGEIIDSEARYLKDFATPIRIRFQRENAGEDGNLEGNYLKGIQAGEDWIYRNPLGQVELTDDEIAVGTCLMKMGEYAAGGESFYSMAEACQDRYLDIAIQQAVDSGETVTTGSQAWAEPTV